jgi:hypothetical protein
LLVVAGIGCFGSAGLKTTHGRYQDVRMVVGGVVAGKVSIAGRYMHGVGGLSLERRVGILSKNSKLQIDGVA